jgi:hypothetical protein
VSVLCKPGSSQQLIENNWDWTTGLETKTQVHYFSVRDVMVQWTILPLTLKNLTKNYLTSLFDLVRNTYNAMTRALARCEKAEKF